MDIYIYIYIFKGLNCLIKESKNEICENLLILKSSLPHSCSCNFQFDFYNSFSSSLPTIKTKIERPALKPQEVSFLIGWHIGLVFYNTAPATS